MKSMFGQVALSLAASAMLFGCQTVEKEPEDPKYKATEGTDAEVLARLQASCRMMEAESLAESMKELAEPNCHMAPGFSAHNFTAKSFEAGFQSFSGASVAAAYGKNDAEVFYKVGTAVGTAQSLQSAHPGTDWGSSAADTAILAKAEEATMVQYVMLMQFQEVECLNLEQVANIMQGASSCHILLFHNYQQAYINAFVAACNRAEGDDCEDNAKTAYHRFYERIEGNIKKTAADLKNDRNHQHPKARPQPKDDDSVGA